MKRLYLITILYVSFNSENDVIRMNSLTVLQADDVIDREAIMAAWI